LPQARDIPRLQEIEQAARPRCSSVDGLSFATETPPIAADRLTRGGLVVSEEDLKTG
jgi:hypothetical protein